MASNGKSTHSSRPTSELQNCEILRTSPSYCYCNFMPVRPCCSHNILPETVAGARTISTVFSATKYSRTWPSSNSRPLDSSIHHAKSTSL